MPQTDDFEDFANTDPTEDQLEEARRVLAKSVAATEAPARKPAKKAATKKKPRKSAATIPANAPKPQDHKPKQSPAEKEVKAGTINLTLFGEDVEIDQRSMLESWDWQVGVIQKNPLQMVKGLLGQKRFSWFCLRSQAAGMSPIGAATELIEMFSKEAGFESTGNS